MTDNTLDQIADEIGEVTNEQNDNDTHDPAREGEEFDDEEYRRNKEDYDGGW